MPTQVPSLPPAIGDVYTQVPPPPMALGVSACESWAARVALLCARETEGSIRDPARSLIIASCCKRIGQLAAKALRSEMAAQSAERGCGETVDLLADEPPLAQPVYGVAWVYFRMCRLLHQQLDTGAQLNPEHALLRLNVLSVAGYLSCRGELLALLARIESPHSSSDQTPSEQ